jgi:glycosyltransferase involved in cell wall biosynthesis
LKKIAGVPESWTWRYVRWFHKHSGKVLTTTDSMVTELREHDFDGDIVSWTRGVDREVFHPGYRTNTVVNGPILLYVGRVSKEKNLDDFCNLKFTGANKIIVGDGPYRAELEQRYPEINFVGYKTGADLARYYAMADVFVFPSRWETFGLVMIEAMACGTPVAAYPVQGPEDVVDEGVTGCLNDDLKQAVTDCLFLSRQQVWSSSHRWSWENAWHIFRDNLTPNGKWTDEDGYS